MQSRTIRFLTGGTLLALLCLQFIRPEKNLSGTEPGPGHLESVHPVPVGVRQILSRACYDCHSDHTRYPWYAAIQPVGWWLDAHIRDAKRELNFSRFGNYSRRRQQGQLEAIIDVVLDRSMPLPSYTRIHRDAILTEQEMTELTDWADALMEKISRQR